MPRKLSEEAKAKKSAYDQKYAHSNIERLFIPFNKTNDADMRRLEWVKQKGDRQKTQYIKELIDKDMGSGK